MVHDFYPLDTQLKVVSNIPKLKLKNKKKCSKIFISKPKAMNMVYQKFLEQNKFLNYSWVDIFLSTVLPEHISTLRFPGLPIFPGQLSPCLDASFSSFSIDSFSHS